MKQILIMCALTLALIASGTVRHKPARSPKGGEQRKSLGAPMTPASLLPPMPTKTLALKVTVVPLPTRELTVNDWPVMEHYIPITAAMAMPTNASDYVWDVMFSTNGVNGPWQVFEVYGSGWTYPFEGEICFMGGWPKSGTMLWRMRGRVP